MIRMHIRVLPMRGTTQRDEGTAEWSGKAYRAVASHGVTMALARQLVADGCPDQRWQAFHNGAPSLQGPSLHGLAKLSVTEGDKSAIRFCKFRDMENMQTPVYGHRKEGGLADGVVS